LPLRRSMKGMPMKQTELVEHARKLWEAHGAKSIAEAAQKAVALEKAGRNNLARNWRRIEAILLEMRGPRQS